MLTRIFISFILFTIISCNTTTKETNKMQTGYAPVNGLKMYYEIHGSGDPLILIHGGGSSIQTTFGYMLPLLAKHFKIIAVELQAHGHTNDRNAPESFEQDADDVAGLLKHLAISKAHFFGFSNGGNTTMQIGIRHPQLVNKLVIAAAFYKREGMIEGFFEGMERATLDSMPAVLQQDYLRINNDSKALRNMFEKDRTRMATFKDWKDEDLSSIKAPALLIAGDKDVVAPAHTAAMAKLIPNSQLMILPGTHGSFMWEEMAGNQKSKIPDLALAAIVEFLNK